jgi:hypothetical protein
MQAGLLLTTVQILPRFSSNSDLGSVFRRRESWEPMRQSPPHQLDSKLPTVVWHPHLVTYVADHDPCLLPYTVVFYIFDRVCWEYGIDHHLTKTNHPCTNGQVEGMNRTLKEAIVKKYYYQTRWLKEHLYSFLLKGLPKPIEVWPNTSPPPGVRRTATTASRKSHPAALSATLQPLK